jgi:hypothetical protein
MTLFCPVGWEYIEISKEKRKMAIKFLLNSDRFIMGSFIIQYRCQKVFQRIYFMGIKNAKFYADFKNTNLP